MYYYSRTGSTQQQDKDHILNTPNLGNEQIVGGFPNSNYHSHLGPSVPLVSNPLSRVTPPNQQMISTNPPNGAQQSRFPSMAHMVVPPRSAGAPTSAIPVASSTSSIIRPSGNPMPQGRNPVSSISALGSVSSSRLNGSPQMGQNVNINPMGLPSRGSGGYPDMNLIPKNANMQPISNPYMQGKPISKPSMLHSGSGPPLQEGETLAFDMSDFPALRASPITAPASKPTPPEFTLQNLDDFPALPGSKPPPKHEQQPPIQQIQQSSQSLDDQSNEHYAHGGSNYSNNNGKGNALGQSVGQPFFNSTSPSLRSLSNSGGVPPPPGLASYDPSTTGRMLQSPPRKLSTTPPPIQNASTINVNPTTQILSQQTPNSQIPSSSPNRFGLLGLLSVIRMVDPDLNTLALGTDLTTLGLNLNSPDCLYGTFVSPFSEESSSKREPDFFLPLCYYAQPPLQPPTMKMQLFSEETLFYIFYSMPRDALQIHAANELYNRDWRYHKEHKLWFTRVHGTEPSLKTSTYERGSYYYFDINSWERTRRDNFVLVYEQLETKQ